MAAVLGQLGHVQRLRLILGTSLALAAIVLWRIYHARYVELRDCFNELGRCFDPETGVVHLEQGGVLWLTLACLAALGAVLCLWPTLKTRLRR